MVLWPGITGITGITLSCGGLGKSLIPRSETTWDNREVRPDGHGLVVMTALLCQAGGELGRWSL
jgi:hypothetical protein